MTDRSTRAPGSPSSSPSSACQPLELSLFLLPISKSEAECNPKSSVLMQGISADLASISLLRHAASTLIQRRGGIFSCITNSDMPGHDESCLPAAECGVNSTSTTCSPPRIAATILLRCFSTFEKLDITIAISYFFFAMPSTRLPLLLHSASIRYTTVASRA
jgi:hypothetical protein